MENEQKEQPIPSIPSIPFWERLSAKDIPQYTGHVIEAVKEEDVETERCVNLKKGIEDVLTNISADTGELFYLRRPNS